jgi:predicted amino acid-binding ACT domain protein/phosphoserine phosphatase
MAAREKLYVVYGAGSDAVGLVQQITRPIADARANIVDMRQDVLHGLFTLFMLVDLAESTLAPEQFKALIAAIGDETGLSLAADNYQPVPRRSDRRSLLVILVGRDKPGVIARTSALLSNYRVNIEFMRTVARAGVFLMELHADITNAALPLENLEAALIEAMRAMDIRALFQAEDVFNKKKRVVCFDIGGSLIPGEIFRQVLEQAGITAGELQALYAPQRVRASVEAAAARLEGLPTEIAKRIGETMAVTPDSIELVETLKTMGYKILVLSTAFQFCTESLARKAALDACYGYRASVNDDAQAFTGAISPHHDPQDRRRILGGFLQREGIAEEDVTVLGDEAAGAAGTPGIRIEFDMKALLDYYNQRCIGREQLVGLLGSFGVPRL